MQIIEEIAEEGSTFIPSVAFYDEDGAAFTPVTLYWKLTDLSGNVVNSRTQVTVGSPSTSLAVALSGGDLDVLGDDVAARIWTVWGTYTSGTYGTCPFLFQAKFNVQPKVGG